MLKQVYRAALLHGLGRVYGPSGTDCVSFLVDVLDEVLGGLPLQVQRDIAISHGDTSRPWSGIEALVALGHQEVAAPVPGRAHVCQRWQGLDQGRIVPASRGHAYLFVADPHGDGGMVIEATNRDHQWAWGASWASARLHPPGSQTRLVVLELS